MLRRISTFLISRCPKTLLHKQPDSPRRWIFSQGYRPGPSTENVLYGLIGVNSVVFLGWQMLDPSFMKQHFTSSLQNLRAGRIHTLITTAFSHYSILHMGTNLIALYFFGRALGQVLLGKQLLNLYLIGGLAGSLADTYWKYSATRGWKRWNSPATLGASGAVNSVVTLFICLFPREIIYLNFFIPVPAFLLGLLFILHDIAFLKQGQDSVSHAGHLGGVAIGLIYFFRLRYLRR